MTRYIAIILLIINPLRLPAQEETLTLTLKQIETLFLENNLELIAAKYNISVADAAISQARLWDNPNLSFSNINLWSTHSQREGEKEVIPPLWGSFGRNTEFSIELSQLIQTANKRGRLIKREKVSKDMAIQEFEETLRGLKTELRKAVYQIIYLQFYANVINQQKQAMGKLIQSFQKQYQDGNIAKTGLLRLQTSYFELDNELNDIQTERKEQEKNLKILLNLNPLNHIVIADNQNLNNPNSLSFPILLDMAQQARPDLKLQTLKVDYHLKSLNYEKSMRIPDITFSANYDRYGGVWKNFIGFGLSIDLPFFNRNQGNIKAAKLNIDQSMAMAQQHKNVINNEVATSYYNYIDAYNLYHKFTENSLFTELDDMIDIYTKNLLNKNISMMEYIDFMDACKTTKQTMLNAKRKAEIQFEELQFTIGKDID